MWFETVLNSFGCTIKSAMYKCIRMLSAHGVYYKVISDMQLSSRLASEIVAD